MMKETAGRRIEKSRHYRPTSTRTTTTQIQNSQNGRPTRVPAEGYDAVMERVASGHACTVRPLSACIRYCTNQLQALTTSGEGPAIGGHPQTQSPLFDSRPPRFPFAADDRGRLVLSTSGSRNTCQAWTMYK
ncbi:hypothetical protein V8C35DRAFT_303315 [Trichoderma chlorosporum]